MAVDPRLGPWAQARLPASWRGVTFRVRESQVKRGRKQAIHEYPFRDTVWVEDLNRAARISSFRGFLVGDDVDAQLQAMIAAVETPGPGTLVHPALGNITASCVDFTASEGDGEGRTWTIEFSFLESAGRVFPTAAANTQGVVASATASAASPLAATFGSAIAPQGLLNTPAGTPVTLPAQTVLTPGTFTTGLTFTASQPPSLAVVGGIQSTLGSYINQANTLVAGAAPIARAAIGLAGNFGRFSLGARLSTVPGLANAQAALTQASAAAASANRIAGSLAGLAAQL